MTAPEDDLAAALRNALSAAVSQVEPGADGLEKIRARTSTRPPHPWLLSVLVGAADRVRYWTWRGHWSWTWTWRGHWSWTWLRSPGPWPRPLRLGPVSWSAIPWPRLRRLPLPTGTRQFPAPVTWIRPVAVLAGVAVIAGVTLAVPPFRQAILTASSNVLDGGSGPLAGGAVTDGNGTPSQAGSGTPLGSGTAQPGSAGAVTPQPTGTGPHLLPSPDTATSPGCQPSSGSGQAGAQLAVPAPSQPQRPSLVGPDPTSRAYYSRTATTTSCATPTPQATPTPSASGGSPSQTPTSSGSATPTPTATTSSPTATPTTPAPATTTPSPTATPTASVSPTATPSASVSTASSGTASSGTASDADPTGDASGAGARPGPPAHPRHR